MKIPVIYKIRNLTNDKFYVGSTWDMFTRKRTHLSRLRNNRHHSAYLQNAWNKHGEDAFVFEVVEELPLDAPPEALEAAEDRWLLEHVGAKYCYNVGRSARSPWRGAHGAETPFYGKHHTDDAKGMLSEATKKQWATSDPRTGRKHSPETRRKIKNKMQQVLSEGRGGKFIPTEETRKKMSESLKGNQCAKGYKRTDAEKAAISDRMKGNQNWLGRNHAEESIDKMGITAYSVSPDGVVTRYPSMNAMRKDLGMKGQSSILRAIRSGLPLSAGPHAGWSFYTEEEDNRVPVPEEYRGYPRTRKEAKERGVKYYFTGTPCKQGHVALRLVKGTCTECLKVEATPLEDAVEVGYSHSPQYRATNLLVIVPDYVKPARSEYPTKLVYLGRRNGLPTVGIDTYTLPQDYELAVCMLFRGELDRFPAVYWSEADKAFPAHAVALLRQLAEVLSFGA